MLTPRARRHHRADVAAEKHYSDKVENDFSNDVKETLFFQNLK